MTTKSSESIMRSRQSTDKDLDLIEQALKDWRGFARSFRYGGLYAEYEEAKRALGAFERVRAWVESPQLTLPLVEEVTS